MDFQNTAEMENVFNDIIKNAVFDITKEMETRIKDEIDSHGIGYANKVYENTDEFKNAWVQSNPQKIANGTYEGDLHYEVSMIKTHNPDKWQHDSQVEGWTGVNIDEFLPNIIFETGSYPLWGENHSTKPRDAFSPMISSMDRSFAKLMRDSFAKSGIKLDTSKTYKSSF